MKKKAKSKVKSVKRAARSTAAAEPEMPGLVQAMTRIAERLDALERKMDLMVKPGAPAAARPQPAPQAQHGQPNHAPGHGRQGRPLYQAVCADCRKECEIPFKPTGERPVYCKECFAQRKANGNGPKNGSRPGPVMVQQRQVRPIPNGVGKVTITEMVPASAHHSPARKRPPQMTRGRSARKS